MAVVQISRIQVRRGQKNSGIGVPQLSSGEFAWAVDSQELFIGNGSVAEGAPYVGNTKILTEHDNILELASSYRFANEDPAIVYSQKRTLQEKLDEYVSILDYGAIPDGSTDCRENFEKAFDDLFTNAEDKYKKPLFIPNGIYLIQSGNLRIPSDAVIVGENLERTILNIGNNDILFINTAGAGYPFTSSNRPQNISISNITISRESGQVVLSGIKNSKFSNVKWQGEYELGDSVSAMNIREACISWENAITGITVTGIDFVGCRFENAPLAIRLDQTNNSESYITFDNSTFKACETGIYIEGFPNQKTFWNLRDCRFEEIYSHAILTTEGRGMKVSRSLFNNCGNSGNSASAPTSSIISFGDNLDNIIENCSFNRHQNAGVLSNPTAIQAVAEVYNANQVTINDRYYANVAPTDSLTPIAVFSSYNRYTVLNYLLVLGTDQDDSTAGIRFSRSGTITITTGDDLAGLDNISNVSFTDNYSYSPGTLTALGGPLMTNFEFSVAARDIPGGDSGSTTLVLSYRNPIGYGRPGVLSYSITYGV